MEQKPIIDVVEEPIVKVEPVVKIEKPVVKKESETSKPTYEEIEKPKVKVDVDSVVVNKPSNNDDFFDDFFGGEGE